LTVLTIHVATRKGPFAVTRTARGWDVGLLGFLGEPVTMVLADPRDRRLYAALAHGHFGPKLHVSDDGGARWREIACPSYPLAPEDAEERPAVHLIWALEPGARAEPGVLWAGTQPGGLFRSTDGGASWTLVESLWHRPERKEWIGGGNDYPGIHSILVDPRDSRRLILAVSVGGVWHSEDAGASWACKADGMFAAYMPPDQRDAPHLQDVHRLARCAARPDVLWAQHHNGVFRSTDNGATWREIATVTPSVFGFAVAAHPDDPETAWFVPAIKDECRVPVDGRLVVARTTDGGARFTEQTEGLPGRNAYDLIYRHALDVDGTGRNLAMGSTTGSLWVSEDGGARWTLVNAHLPPIAAVRFAPA
jgi:photosystem II stability/assembly factor-like uncharacterized protein